MDKIIQKELDSVKQQVKNSGSFMPTWRVLELLDELSAVIDATQTSQDAEPVKPKNRQELINECDMLEGNINRIMVTNDREELYQQLITAQKRLAIIATENHNRLGNKAHPTT